MSMEHWWRGGDRATRKLCCTLGKDFPTLTLSAINVTRIAPDQTRAATTIFTRLSVTPMHISQGTRNIRGLFYVLSSFSLDL